MKFSLTRVLSVLELSKILDAGLRKLTFRDNFLADIVDITLEPGVDTEIPHNLKNIPNMYIIGSKDAEGDIIKSDIAWTSSAIYLKNTGINTINATIIILER